MTPIEYRSALGSSIARYIEFAENCSGNVNKTRRWYLRSFDSYCADHNYTTCCKEAVEGWGAEIEKKHRSEVRNWIGIIRGYGRYLGLNGSPDTYILSEKYRSKKVKRKPYLLSSDEVNSFFEAASDFDIRDVPWKWQACAFFGLMHSCGLRTRETRLLSTENVDISGMTIDILGTKTNADRRVYITDEVAALLEECKWTTDARFGSESRPFFVSNTGRAVCASSAGNMFTKIWNQACLPICKEGKRPRPYDLRHHFAYANIEKRMAEGRDVNAMLPYLSRYMGHSGIKSTLYYIHTSPDFMTAYANIVHSTERLLPEVGFDD